MLAELIHLYSQHPSSKQLLDLLREDNCPRVHCSGLTGSSGSLLAAAVIPGLSGTHLIILPDKDDAAYFYNDLVNLAGSDTVLFFPSSFKRSVHYNQLDHGNMILRAMS
jgi:transcription-repair coupling factor (superfamily II helicase)